MSFDRSGIAGRVGLGRAAVGFIGLGAMGGAMAQRLAEAGLKLHVVEPERRARRLTLGLAEAEAAGVPTSAQLWRFAMLQGGGADDFTSLIKYIEGWAGVEVRGAATPGR